MSKVKVIHIQESALPGEPEIIKMLPGVFDNHRHALDAIQEAGNYAFLEVHALEPKPKPQEG